MDRPLSYNVTKYSLIALDVLSVIGFLLCVFFVHIFDAENVAITIFVAFVEINFIISLIGAAAENGIIVISTGCITGVVILLAVWFMNLYKVAGLNHYYWGLIPFLGIVILSFMYAILLSELKSRYEPEEIQEPAYRTRNYEVPKPKVTVERANSLAGRYVLAARLPNDDRFDHNMNNTGPQSAPPVIDGDPNAYGRGFNPGQFTIVGALRPQSLPLIV